MAYEFLRRLYMSCSEQSGGTYGFGLNLEELYQQFEETETARDSLYSAAERLSPDKGKVDDLTSVCYEVAEAYELQGFINGFRLCWMLHGEMEMPPKEDSERRCSQHGTQRSAVEV